MKNSDNTKHADQEELHPEKQGYLLNSDIAKPNTQLLSEGQGCRCYMCSITFNKANRFRSDYFNGEFS